MCGGFRRFEDGFEWEEGAVPEQVLHGGGPHCHGLYGGEAGGFKCERISE